MLIGMDIEIIHKNEDYVLFPKKKFDSIMATIEVMKDKDLMKQIKESKKAKSRPFKDLVRELDL
ncbi:MAG: hypothetical protein ABEK36_06350 [Candidatus Aenigmatarchaeota archaeon]